MNFAIKKEIDKIPLEHLVNLDEKAILALFDCEFTQVNEYIQSRVEFLEKKQKVHNSKKYKDFIQEIKNLYEDLSKLLEPIELQINLPLAIKVEFVKPKEIKYLLQTITDRIPAQAAIGDFSPEIVTIKASPTEALDKTQLKVINTILEELSFEISESDVEKFFKKNRQNLLTKLSKLIKAWGSFHDQGINHNDLIESLDDKKDKKKTT